MSYFAKPHFIIYDEWFDENLEKPKPDINHKKIKNISNIHEFFYEQSNYKIGASENNMQSDVKVHEKELITNNYINNNLEQFTSLSYKKFSFFEKLTNSQHQFSISKKLIYSLSILGFVFIFGFIIFFISSSRKSESNITNTFLNIEKEF
ncbi:hypothetical protein [Prochlorococcus marinus]|uniref:hypothetical protein n=1 Tax=Prochlorococcus marinus TaxID=1219 RepID=UPI001ADAAD8C|nr:hypothetical protein [Prochlorococcus marinus]MBO8205105.1 hypothetical protein [Prochlorococcus marinus CUG1415]MBW3044373.1 hypothetical protein [Prochlorococcus marinus str. MU1415]